MRCVACNCNLNDFETTRKHAITGEYLDMCNRCVVDLDVPTKDRKDLISESDLDLDGLEHIEDGPFEGVLTNTKKYGKIYFKGDYEETE
jgi:hypothetical protein